MQHEARPAVLSLVVWSALIPIVPFMAASFILEGPQAMLKSPVEIDLTTILSLIYPAFVASIIGYGIWGSLLGRYETPARGAVIAAGTGGRACQRRTVAG